MLKKINWRYAIGEIIIVIIGISIAFNLNSWAEKRSEDKAARTYLENLRADLSSEKAHLEENILRFEQHLSLIQGLFPLLHGMQEGRDTMAMKVFDLAQIVYFNPNDITYKAMINSGDLGLLEDIDFKKELESHYVNHEVMQLDYNRQVNIHERYFGDFMIHEMDFGRVRSGDYSFLDSKLLRNTIQSLYGTFQICIETSEKGITRCDELSKLVEAQLQVL